MRKYLLMILIYIIPWKLLAPIAKFTGKFEVFTEVDAYCYYPREKHTADKSRVPRHQKRWVAISRDLLNDFPFKSVILVSGADIYDGEWIVKDLMNKRHCYSIDFMVINKKKYTLDHWNSVKIKRLK